MCAEPDELAGFGYPVPHGSDVVVGGFSRHDCVARVGAELAERHGCKVTVHDTGTLPLSDSAVGYYNGRPAPSGAAAKIDVPEWIDPATAGVLTGYWTERGHGGWATAVPGHCLHASEDFEAWLGTQRVPCTGVEVLDHGGWGGSHYATMLPNGDGFAVVDWTARQFDDEAPVPFIERYDPAVHRADSEPAVVRVDALGDPPWRTSPCVYDLSVAAGAAADAEWIGYRTRSDASLSF